MNEVSFSGEKPGHWGDSAALVLGFSTRALAQAVAASGKPLVAVDVFADQDLREVARAVIQPAVWGEVAAGAGGVADIVRQLNKLLSHELRRPDKPFDRVALAGGLENWPQLTTAVLREFDLPGPSSRQLGALRDIENWRHWAAASELRFPSTVAVAKQPTCTPETNLDPGTVRVNQDAPGLWLVKRLNSAGGGHIRRSAARARFQDHQDAVLQQEILGRSVGVTCVLTGDPVPACTILGATEAWTMSDWDGPSEFIYRGNWGPIPLSLCHRRQIEQFGRCVQQQTGWLGWIQADFILDGDQQLWLLEVNPRWTAGMEILFRAGINSVAVHWAAESGAAPPREVSLPQTRFAKAVLYASRELVLRRQEIEQLHRRPRHQLSDLPSQSCAGQPIAAGQPILTVHAELAARAVAGMDFGQQRQTLLASLRARAAEVEEWIGARSISGLSKQ